MKRFGLLGWLATLQLGLLVLGGVGMWLAGLPLIRQPDPLRDTLAFLLLYGVLWALERLIERGFPQSAAETVLLHRQLGLALTRQGFGYPQALGLALLSGVAEEVFFRGFLQAWLGGWTGLIVQAVVFAAMHPTPGRTARVYTVYTLLAGLALGGIFWWTGSLIPGILAHYLHNGRGFYALVEEARGQS